MKRLPLLVLLLISSSVFAEPRGTDPAPPRLEPDATFLLPPHQEDVTLLHNQSTPPAEGLEGIGDSLNVYVTRFATGVYKLINAGQGDITIDSIFCYSPDADWSNGKIPFIVWDAHFVEGTVIHPGETLSIPWTFQPNGFPLQPVTTGRRSYSADLLVYNSTNTVKVIHLGGRGFMVDLHSFIPRTYQTIPEWEFAPIRIMVDEWNDTLGLAKLEGYILEITHYRSTVLSHRTKVKSDTSHNYWNRQPYVEELYSESADGTRGTSSAGGVCVTNIAESDMLTPDTNMHPWHNTDVQGYYELNVKLIPQNAGVIGPLLNLEFHSLALWDTSEIIYELKNPIDENGRDMGYLIISQSPGLVRVGDKIIGDIDPPALPTNTVLIRNYPNPCAQSTTMSYTVAAPGDVELRVVNTLGQIVATPVHAQHTAGTFAVRFDANQLLNGLYFVEMISGTTRSVTNMVVVK